MPPVLAHEVLIYWAGAANRILEPQDEALKAGRKDENEKPALRKRLARVKICKM
jgi:hypothetical protein